ncbi:hypothetical protein ACI6Q2_02620 [Chitinophagaceae bacterium LWZ2-11]
MIETISKFLLPILLAAVPILIYFLKKKDDELTLVKSKLSDKKHDTYSDIIALFFDLFKESKGLTTVNQLQLNNKVIDIKKNLLLLAPDGIVFKYFEFEGVSSSGTHMLAIAKYLELIVLIRKDMGNPKTFLTVDKLLKGLISTMKDYEEILSLIDKETRREVISQTK